MPRPSLPRVFISVWPPWGYAMFPILCSSQVPCLTSILYPLFNVKETKSQALLSTCFLPGPSPVLHTQHTAGSTAVLGGGMINPILPRGNQNSERFHDLPKVTQPGTVVWLCSAPLPGPQIPRTVPSHSLLLRVTTALTSSNISHFSQFEFYI